MKTCLKTIDDEGLFMAQTNLFYKCKLYPDSIPAESVIDSFYTANQNTSIGRFYEFNSLSDTLFVMKSINLETLRINDSLVNNTLIMLEINDSLLNSSVSYTDSLELISEMEELKNSILFFQHTSTTLMNEMDSLSILYSDSLLAINSNISVSTVIEENQKNLNNVIYSTIAKGIFEFDSSQTATLYDIATQCFHSGGKSVPIAQGIYRYINDTIIFVNDTNCTEESPRLAKYNKSEKNHSYIYPNPSSKSATLKFNLPNKQNGFFIIYDVLARELKRFPLQAGADEFEFNSQLFNQGIYSYLIVAEGNIISKGKFSILK